MKVMINGYEVEIKAKYKASDRMNQADTMAVLSQISIWAGESKYRFQQAGCNRLAEIAGEAQGTIYDALDAKGYFDNVK